MKKPRFKWTDETALHFARLASTGQYRFPDCKKIEQKMAHFKKNYFELFANKDNDMSLVNEFELIPGVKIRDARALGMGISVIHEKQAKYAHLSHGLDGFYINTSGRWIYESEKQEVYAEFTQMFIALSKAIQYLKDNPTPSENK